METVQRESQKSLTFMFSGDINELVHSSSSFSIENLSIEEPPLEEIFLRYYK